MQYESVALFHDRARAVNPDFQLTAENAAAVADICARLDGLPLAIELAAARIRLFNPLALLRRLDARLHTLVDGPRDQPARQQTLRNAIGWSYELLDAGERFLFAQLGVFVGGWTLAAAAAVMSFELEVLSEDAGQLKTLETLESLVHKSLIQQREGHDGEPRFGMLETIREFALEQLVERSTAGALRRRHLAYYTTLAETAVQQIFGAEQAACLTRLEQEHANLRAALSWSLASEDDQEALMGLRLAGALGWFWHLRGYWSEGRSWLEQVIADCRLQIADYADADQSTIYNLQSAMARALCSAGILAWAQDDYAIARTYLEESVALAVADREPHTRAHALGLLGLSRLYQGDYAEAAPIFEESLGLFQGLDDTFGVGVSLIRLAIVAKLQGDWARATDLNAQSLSFYQALGNDWGIATSLANQAEVAVAQGDWQTAADYYREALPFMRAISSHWYLALMLVGIASVAIARGQVVAAARLLGTSEALAENVGGRLPPPDRLVYERTLAAARDQLGETAFAAARAKGRALTPEQAVADVLDPSLADA
jgi:non-specific serine/threonine protein kinase